MAKVLGKSGRYVTDAAVSKFRYFLVAIFVGVALDAFLVGIFVERELGSRKSALWMSALPVAATAVLLWFLFVVLDWLLKKLEQKRADFLKASVGEMVVARCLAKLPEEYAVINNLATLHGTLDHVVIGPTGVYIIETRNWRGLITADGQGDILVNRRQLEKPVTRLLLHRMLNVRDQVVLFSAGKLNASEMPVFKGLVVFPSASVEARLGTTGSAFCLSEDQVCDFIVRNKWNDKLDPARIKRLTRAFLALENTDRESLPVARPTSFPTQPPCPDSPQSVFVS